MGNFSRTFRIIGANRGVFWSGVISLSLSFYLLGLVIVGLSGLIGPSSHSEQDQMTVFVRAKTKDKEVKELKNKTIQIVGDTAIRDVAAAELLEQLKRQRIKAASEVNTEQLPLIFSVTLPSNKKIDEIREMVQRLEKLPDVLAVAIDYAWIQKRQILKETIILFSLIIGLPLAVLILRIFWDAISRIVSFTFEEQRLMLMFGASGWKVIAPSVLSSLLLTFTATVFSLILGSAVVFFAWPVISENLALTVESDYLTQGNLLVCLIGYVGLLCLSAIVASLAGRMQEPKTL